MINKDKNYVVYRVFPWDGQSFDNIFPPKSVQGYGRHDIPKLDNVFYCSFKMVSAIAETWKDFYNRDIDVNDLMDTLCIQGERKKVLVRLNIKSSKILDLTNTKILLDMKLQPMDIATHDRQTTQNLASLIHKKGYAGFTWWSSLESQWINMTCFESRIKRNIKKIYKRDLININLDNPNTLEAIKALKIKLRT